MPAKNEASSWPADNVERWPIERLTPYANNARTHSDEQIAKVAASIEEWGWTTPVLVDEAGELIAGHCRVLAARKLGIEMVPVMVATGWTEAQKRAYTLADNQLALGSGWDEAILRSELDALAALDFDMPLLGFDEDELALALGGAAEAPAPLADTEFQHADQYAVIVKCADEVEQEARFNKLREEYGADNVKVVVV